MNYLLTKSIKDTEDMSNSRTEDCGSTLVESKLF